MQIPNKLSYLELPANNLAATKAFFSTVFGWSFTDYGEEYTAFSDQGLDGGFFRSELVSITAEGAALPVIYSQNLAQTEQAVVAAGGVIIQPVFSFPGGRRFHFCEPSGNEFAVWSDL